MLFVGVTVAVRYLGTNMNPVQAAFIRYCFGIVLILPLLSRAGIMSLDRDRLGFHALRGLVHGGGVMLWFLAMSRIPISEVTALGFTTPIFVTLGAAVFLSERLKPYRVAAVLLGFIGALLILRPGLRVIDIGALAQLGAAPLFACLPDGEVSYPPRGQFHDCGPVIGVLHPDTRFAGASGLADAHP